jgi:hypothetical protein
MWIVIAVVVVAIIIAVLLAMRSRGAIGLRKLPPESRGRYETAWRAVEAKFIEQPQAAVAEADRVALDMLRERGANVEEDRLPSQLREARESGRQEEGREGTEGLRMAMLRYREIIEDGIGPVAKRPDTEGGRREVAS